MRYTLSFNSKTSRCLKITEKVSFKIASEASYVYILSGQKLIQSAKNGDFSKTLSLLSNSVTRHVTWKGQKLVENAKINQFKRDILGDFQAMKRSLRLGIS